MKDIPIEFLSCPRCNAEISQVNNRLVCKTNPGHSFSVNSNIISFVGMHDFDDHWSPQVATLIPEQKLKVAREFLKPLLTHIQDNCCVLDVGCGNGVHAKALGDNKNGNLNIDYIGLDISESAVQQARTHIENALFLHADASTIPLKENSVDSVFSYGVIAYTKNPSNTLKELARVLKPGGLLGIWVYTRPSRTKYMALRFVRAVTRAGGPFVTNRIADIIVPFLSYLPVASGLNLRNASWNQCREVVLVNIAPKELSFPGTDTVREWFADAGLSIILEDHDPSMSVWARK